MYRNGIAKKGKNNGTAECIVLRGYKNPAYHLENHRSLTVDKIIIHNHHIVFIAEKYNFQDVIRGGNERCIKCTCRFTRKSKFRYYFKALTNDLQINLRVDAVDLTFTGTLNIQERHPKEWNIPPWLQYL